MVDEVIVDTVKVEKVEESSVDVVGIAVGTVVATEVGNVVATGAGIVVGSVLGIAVGTAVPIVAGAVPFPVAGPVIGTRVCTTVGVVVDSVVATVLASTGNGEGLDVGTASEPMIVVGSTSGVGVSTVAVDVEDSVNIDSEVVGTSVLPGGSWTKGNVGVRNGGGVNLPFPFPLNKSRRLCRGRTWLSLLPR